MQATDEQFRELDREIGHEKHVNTMEVTPDNKLDEIDALLSNDDSESEAPVDDDATPTPPPPQETEEIETEPAPADDAEKPEVEAKSEIDYGLKIPMPDHIGDKTIGELKDAVTEITVKERRIERQKNDLIAERSELETIVNSLGNLSPETKQAIAAYQEANLKRESKLMQEAIPEWQDSVVYNKETAEMRSLANEYNYSDEEFNSVADHRLVNLVRDYTLLRNKVAQQEKDARAKAAPPKKPRGQRQRQNNKQSDVTSIVERGRAATTQAGKTSAINDLLKTL